MVCNVHVHCINHNAGDKPLVVICNVDTKPQGILCLFSSDNLPAKRCTYQDLKWVMQCTYHHYAENTYLNPTIRLFVRLTCDSIRLHKIGPICYNNYPNVHNNNTNISKHALKF